MEPKNQLPPEDTDDNSLETPDTVIEPNSTTTDASSQPDKAPAPGSQPAAAPSGGNSEPPKGKDKIKTFFHRFNVYLLAFIFLFLVSTAVVVVVIFNGQNNNKTPTNTPQSLSESQLEQLSGSAQTIGNSNQVLNIGANTIFKDQVLVQKDLDVAGSIKIGGSLNLPGITVAGGAKFAQIQTNQLSVSGTTSLSGQLISTGGISIAGSSNFSGPVSINDLTVQSLHLNGTLSLDNHIQAGGGTPGRTTGGAVGSGGTTSVNGSDTSGTVNINTGGSPSAGCFVTVFFAQKFNSTPRIVVTPVGSAAGSLEYYVNRSTTSFSICSDSAPSAGASFSFDYIAFD